MNTKRSVPFFTRIALASAALSLASLAQAGDSCHTSCEAVTFRAPQSWTSTEPMVFPIPDATHPIVSVKDPTIVRHDDRWHLIATTADTSGAWGMAYFSFETWAEAANAKPYYFDQNPHFGGYNCAPMAFYFEPQKKWYLIFQSPQPRYSTTDDITNPDSWTAPQDFFEGTPKSVVEGWLDYWIICDDTHAYMFFPDDHGRFYRSRTTIENFPNGFDDPVVILQEDNPGDLFEGSSVYRLKGMDTYLCLVECVAPGNLRYFRAFTANSLDGDWTPMPDTDNWDKSFAGPTNVVTASGDPLWTSHISHGEMLREGYDQNLVLDPQNMIFLYQGMDRHSQEKEYSQLPYRLALIRANKPLQTNQESCCPRD
ncbi:non-reducing end alpha-L-arabinofuranosidase family hydrolase [Pelagicoccus sp. SDUM812003]|uniref:non-reducing end alpha-L-arabinofuranosidase family hydrolase n=1 Tax=Pelagicoccus sp. SDUM812003 TaxID=3041267 RepID=UPI00280D7BB7|nr:non-reducing end alpha-L-arabinofuranosidase family hydrolase [Pelagicoccus sp. SDUM812003]MDQ8202155.1 non-reducing end alpha-L-arabinofuranosidase family hydrolase [Pelagicoccus sp. SDUM812003]